MGKTQPVRIYELMDLANMPLPETTKNLPEVYHIGLNAHHDRKWDEGVAYMEYAMTFKPDDSGCRLYIERMRLFQIHLSVAEWNGEFVSRAK